MNKVMGGWEGDGWSGWDGCRQVTQIHAVIGTSNSVVGIVNFRDILDAIVIPWELIQ